MKKLAIAFMIFVFVVGCGGTSGRLKNVLSQAPIMGGYIECSSDCKIKWERAQLWITKHSMMKIQTSTDVMIDTYNPVGQKVIYHFTVMKEPLGNDSYRISIQMNCGNALGCSPEPSDVETAFLYYVKDGVDLLDGQGYLGSIR
ncbi:MAG: hypothetical protein WCO89_03735 [Syntrophus sp. (in: bacteria)]